MGRGKWVWRLLLLLGAFPFLFALGYCVVSSSLDGGGPLMHMTLWDYLLFYSFLYWPTYVIGAVLIVVAAVKLKKKHREV